MSFIDRVAAKAPNYQSGCTVCQLLDRLADEGKTEYRDEVARAIEISREQSARTANSSQKTVTWRGIADTLLEDGYEVSVKALGNHSQKGHRS